MCVCVCEIGRMIANNCGVEFEVCVVGMADCGLDGEITLMCVYMCCMSSPLWYYCRVEL